MSITPERCVNCHLCKDACPFGAITTPTPDLPTPRREGKGRLGALLLLTLLGFPG